MVIHKPEVDQSKSLSGMRVLIAVVVGFAIAAAVAFFLKVLIDNSPAEIDLRRLRLFYLMVITSGGLSGLAIETMRQLQEQATDPRYRKTNPYRGRLRRCSDLVADWVQSTKKPPLGAALICWWNRLRSGDHGGLCHLGALLDFG